MTNKKKLRYLVDNGPVKTSIHFDCCVVCGIFKNRIYGIGIYEKGETLIEYFPTNRDSFFDIVKNIVSVVGVKESIVRADIVDPVVMRLVDYLRTK